MKTRNLLIAFIVILRFSTFSIAQSKEVLEKIEDENLACYHVGLEIKKSEDYILKCQQNYLVKLDSLLKVVYKNYRSTLNSKAKKELKKDQREWLSDRRKYFKETKKEFLYEKHPKPIDHVIAIDHYAYFITDRIEYLMDLLND